MEDIREQIEVANEVGQAISTPLGMDDVDEQDLEDELERLVEEDLQNQFKDVSVPTNGQKGTSFPLVISLYSSERLHCSPAVPAQPAKAKPSAEEDEFAALGAEMGI